MATVSDVDVCNLALSRIGAKARLMALTDQLVEAGVCKLHFPQVRDEVLEAVDWWFARKSRSLALVPDTNPSQWSFCYALPGDMIVPRRLKKELYSNVDYPYELIKLDASDAGMICTNVESANLIYTYQLTDMARTTPLFRNALAWKLGHDIAGPLNIPVNRAQYAMGQFQMSIQSAAASAANQDNNRTNDSTPDWLAARGGTVAGLPEVI